MSEVSWENAPEDAEFYADRLFRKGEPVHFWSGGCWYEMSATRDEFKKFHDYCERPQPKPSVTHQEAISGQVERECSFPQVAEAFNAITGKQLLGSDVCLILALVKQVRQYAQPDRFHEDSAIDGVNYTALQAELLKKERG